MQLCCLKRAGERDPNVRTHVSHRLPSGRGNTPAPYGHQSPDLLLSGPELSRGFSRSASRPQAGVGGASTKWHSTRPSASRSCIGVGHWANDSCVWEHPGIRSVSSLRIHLCPDPGSGRSCCRAALVITRRKLTVLAVEVSFCGCSVFLNVSWPACCLAFVDTLCAGVVPPLCRKKNGTRPL